ncbi:ORF46 [Ictalurid herpesvirus 1]|nr:ORF46 [Ictalurid herpesvirus 1]
MKKTVLAIILIPIVCAVVGETAADDEVFFLSAPQLDGTLIDSWGTDAVITGSTLMNRLWKIFTVSATHTLREYGRVAKSVNSTAATKCTHLCVPGTVLKLSVQATRSNASNNASWRFARPVIMNIHELNTTCIPMEYDCEEVISEKTPLNTLSITIYGSNDLKKALGENSTCNKTWTQGCAIATALTALHANKSVDARKLNILRGTSYTCLLGYLGIGELEPNSPCWTQLGPMCYGPLAEQVCVTAGRNPFGVVPRADRPVSTGVDCRVGSRADLQFSGLTKGLFAERGCDRVFVRCDLIDPHDPPATAAEFELHFECRSSFHVSGFPGEGEDMGLELAFNNFGLEGLIRTKQDRLTIITNIFDGRNNKYSALMINWIPTPDLLDTFHVFMAELDTFRKTYRPAVSLGVVITGASPFVEQYDFKLLNSVVDMIYIQPQIQPMDRTSTLTCPMPIRSGPVECGEPHHQCPGFAGYRHLTYATRFLLGHISPEKLTLGLDVSGQLWGRRVHQSDTDWYFQYDLFSEVQGGWVSRGYITAVIQPNMTQAIQLNGCHGVFGPELDILLPSAGAIPHVGLLWSQPSDLEDAVDFSMALGITRFSIEGALGDVYIDSSENLKTVSTVHEAVTVRMRAHAMMEEMLGEGGLAAFDESMIWANVTRSTGTATTGARKRRALTTQSPDGVNRTIPFSAGVQSGTSIVRIGTGPKMVCPGIIASVRGLLFSRTSYQGFYRLTFFQNLYVTHLQNLTGCTAVKPEDLPVITQATKVPSVFAIDINTFGVVNGSEYYVVGLEGTDLVQYSPQVKQSCAFINTNETFNQTFITIDERFFFTGPRPVADGFVIPAGINFFGSDNIMTVDYIDFNVTCMNYSNPSVQSCIATVCAANVTECTPRATLLCNQTAAILLDFQRSNELLKNSLVDLDLEHEKVKMFAPASGGSVPTSDKFGLSVAAITMSSAALVASTAALAVATLAASKIDGLQAQLDKTADVITELGDSIALISAKLDRNIRAVNGRVDDLQNQINLQMLAMDTNFKRLATGLKELGTTTNERLGEVMAYQQWYQQIMSLTNQVTQGAIQIGYKVGMIRTCVKSLLAGTMAGCPTDASSFRDHPGLTFRKTVRALLYRDQKLFIVNEVPQTLTARSVQVFIPSPTIMEKKVCWPDYKLMHVDGKVVAPLECTGKYCSEPIEATDYQECLTNPSTCRYVCGDCYRGICYNRTTEDISIKFENVTHALSVSDLTSPLFNSIPQIVSMEMEIQDLKLELIQLQKINTSVHMENITGDIDAMKATIDEYRAEMLRLRVTGFGEWLKYFIYALLGVIAIGILIALIFMAVKCYQARALLSMTDYYSVPTRPMEMMY